MATRPFNRFDVATPAITQTRQALVDGIRDNQIAMYLNAALYGGIGWNGPTITRDGYGRATRGIATNADDPVAVRVDWTYYTTGPAEGLCQAAALYYSEDYTGDGSAATWAAVGTLTFTYDAGGNLLSSVWAYA
ncbi:MAG: hypothetical protein FWC38_05980 [Proteobacteria bacterium]|nr:hypothetical protein [Pseudomonadota bacterium]MCL2307759.1 hypothetical protein [Pseudomonadota bacterium]